MAATSSVPPTSRVVRVLPDLTGIDRTFDYLSADFALDVGTEVRVRLGARNVRGWVVACEVEPPANLRLQNVIAVRGVGPSADMVELTAWAADRWVGHQVHLMRLASSPSLIPALVAPAKTPVPVSVETQDDPLVSDALGRPCSVVRLPPALDRTRFMVALLARSLDGRADASAVVVCPTRRAVARLVPRLRAVGFDVVDVSIEGPKSLRGAAWAKAAAGGCVVVGTRNAAWAPAPNPSIMIVVDEHDEALQSQRSPTWHARDVLAERARRSGAPFVALSAAPSLDVLAWCTQILPSRAVERAGWPALTVIDRREEDPALASSLFSESLARRLDGLDRVVCILNRTGRVRLLACRECGALARCAQCGASVHAPGDGALVCQRCATSRPRICIECGSGALKELRVGVSRAREELEALLGEPVVEITGASDRTGNSPLDTRVVIGTEAVLHRSAAASAVVFLDFDAELTAPRVRAGEQAMILLVRAARLLASKTVGRSLIVQTRLAEHPVLQAAGAGDPSIFINHERSLRRTLGMPPFAALALVSGPGASAFLTPRTPLSLEILDGGDGTFLVRADDHEILSGTLRALDRPKERVRIEIDPLGV